MNAGVMRLFRTGISLDATIQLQRVLDNISSIGGNNFSTFALSLNIPLLRNRGRKVVAAQESAALDEVVAAKQDFSQEASTLLQTVAGSYWNLLESQKLLQIAIASQERAQTYLGNVEALVDADQIPKNDLHELEANLAQRSATRITAEQNVVAAQQQLVLDMGLDSPKADDSAFWASDDFPSAMSQTLLAEVSTHIAEYVAVALTRRGDYLAAQQRIAEQQLLAGAARNRLAPQLDLNLNAGYSGLQAGRKFFNLIDASGTSVPGPNAGASLTFTFPPRNEVARGQLVQATAVVRQVEFQRQQVQHEILTEVTTSLSALVHSSQATEQAIRAVEASQASLDGEREKYRVGMGSVVDLVTIEDRLNTALSNQIQSQAAYALALSQLRFATATFVERKDKSFILNDHVFETVPNPHSAQSDFDQR